MLQPTELSFHGSASPVEVAPSLGLARDERVEAVGLYPTGCGLALAGRAAPLRRVSLRVRPGERPGSVLALWRAVLAPLHRWCLPKGDNGVGTGRLARFVDGLYVIAAIKSNGRGLELPLADALQEVSARLDSCSRAVRTFQATGSSVRAQTAAWMRPYSRISRRWHKREGRSRRSLRRGRSRADACRSVRSGGRSHSPGAGARSGRDRGRDPGRRRPARLRGRARAARRGATACELACPLGDLKCPQRSESETRPT